MDTHPRDSNFLPSLIKKNFFAGHTLIFRIKLIILNFNFLSPLGIQSTHNPANSEGLDLPFPLHHRAGRQGKPATPIASPLPSNHATWWQLFRRPPGAWIRFLVCHPPAMKRCRLVFCDYVICDEVTFGPVTTLAFYKEADLGLVSRGPSNEPASMPTPWWLAFHLAWI